MEYTSVAAMNTTPGLTTMTAVPVPVATGTTTSLPINGVWCNYPESVGQILSTAAPAVQVEIGNPDNIARQFNQQVQAQYGNLQVQVLPHTLLSAKDEPELITSDIVIQPPKVSKPRVRTGANERIPCEQCGKTVSCNATLKDHMRTHTGERPFKCSECNLAFAQRSNLRMHKRLHTGERPYMCGICGKTFARSSHLPAHMRTHTGEKPYVCNQCNHAFITAQQLKNHYRVHTGEKPWKCDQCEAAFTHSSSLSTHKKKHTGNKPFTCEVCEKSFFFVSALDKHRKVHSKERPFHCEKCQKSFKYKESLTVHMDKYCGKEALKRPRAKRRSDARKPGPKPGTGRKYILKKKNKPRGRPRKRGRWSKRQIVKRNYKEMEDGANIDFEEIEKQEPFDSILNPGPHEQDMDSNQQQITLDNNQENVPVAELKVEVLNPEDGLVRLTEHINVNSQQIQQHQQPPPEVSTHLQDPSVHPQTHEIRIDDAAALTIVSADDTEQVAAMGGVQLVALPPDIPIQLINQNGEAISGQLITRDATQMWYPRQYP